LDKNNKIDIVVYSGDIGVTGADILEKAKVRLFSGAWYWTHQIILLQGL
jgi:hypothetical protein